MMFNPRAQAAYEAGLKIQEEKISVGDMVFASPGGAYFVNAYVWAIEDNAIIFQTRSGLLFDCPRELAEQVTVLISKFEDTPKASLINDILSLAGVA